jgi:hypothetical protein
LLQNILSFRGREFLGLLKSHFLACHFQSPLPLRLWIVLACADYKILQTLAGWKRETLWREIRLLTRLFRRRFSHLAGTRSTGLFFLFKLRVQFLCMTGIPAHVALPAYTNRNLFSFASHPQYFLSARRLRLKRQSRFHFIAKRYATFGG